MFKYAESLINRQTLTPINWESAEFLSILHNFSEGLLCISAESLSESVQNGQNKETCFNMLESSYI